MLQFYIVETTQELVADFRNMAPCTCFIIGVMAMTKQQSQIRPSGFFVAMIQIPFLRTILMPQCVNFFF